MMAGVNAGHYARELMWNCAERARKVGSTTDPKSVLVYAAKRTKAKGTAATLIASLYKQVRSNLEVYRSHTDLNNGRGYYQGRSTMLLGSCDP